MTITYQGLKIKKEQLKNEYFYNSIRKIRALIKNNSIKTYWWIDIPNFGDRITPQLLSVYGFTPIYTTPANSELVSTGSILEHLNESYKGIIIGSGFINSLSKRTFPNAKILALRGELSRQNILKSNNIILGDPGLLGYKLLEKRQKKKHLLGIILHFEDKSILQIENFQFYEKDKIKLINVQKDPKEVIKEIDSCEYILSSSLHGLVFADSLDIPNGWFFLEETKRDPFKYNDYYSAFGEVRYPEVITKETKFIELINSTKLPNTKINEIKYNLDTLFRDLRNFI